MKKIVCRFMIPYSYSVLPMNHTSITILPGLLFILNRRVNIKIKMKSLNQITIFKWIYKNQILYSKFVLLFSQKMILSAGMFLFNIFCSLTSYCDLVYNAPEILSQPRDDFELARNLEKIQVEPIVKTNSGKVQGHFMKSTKGRTFFAFEGIPYGETTGGRNRWKPPIPKRPWEGIRNATLPGKECLQVSLQKLLRVVGSEDCLFLNVYTPNLPSSRLTDVGYPVIVFIHGGCFIFGSGSEYGPLYLLNEDVILVTLNYRLGVMGFLSTGDLTMPGNYGLKDQALALKWVYENIAYFGGNRNNITLMGNSAGGVSVHLHMISNQTREYFTTGFSSSGSAFNYWGVITHDRMQHFRNRLAKRFGCQNKDKRKLIKCLKKIDSNFLVAAQTMLMDWFPLPATWFTPVVEPDHEGAFLTISPEEAYRQNAVAKKPCIFGLTKDEGKLIMMIMFIFGRTIPLRLIWSQVAPHYLQYKHLVNGSEEEDDITKKITDFYLGRKPPLLADDDSFADMNTDRFLSFGVIRGLQEHANSGAPSYLYYFSFSEGNTNSGNTIGVKSSEWGAAHTEDISYILDSPYIKGGPKLSDPDTELSSVMVKFVVNFALTGRPTYVTENGEVLDVWKPVKNPREIYCIQFDKHIDMIPYPENETNRINFWNSLNLEDSRLLYPLQINKNRKT